MEFGWVTLVLSALAINIFWLDHMVRYSSPNDSPFPPLVFPLIIRNDTDSFYLYSPNFEKWVETNTLGKQLYTSTVEIIENVMKTFCDMNIATRNSWACNSCCLAISKLTTRETLLDCLRSVGYIGSSSRVQTTDIGSIKLSKRPPNYVHSQIYIDEPGEPNREINCRVEYAKRMHMYELLLHWIELAERHGIVWWLVYGSLLGAVRHEDFIPYDHDIDIGVIGSQVDLIRSLSTDWHKLKMSQTNLITRQGNYCINDNIPRLNCQGVPVRYQLDPCAFCTPFARLISGYFTFLDVFVFHPRLLLNATNKNDVRLGLFDEAVDADKGEIISYTLDSVFPLSSCQYMGLRVPCPRKSDVVLTHLYGPNLLLPSRMCSRRYGLWYSAF
ncbi:hypothetical protein PHET_02644 [Paragonimus heterotremus]|uniref:LicD/FKTN/FKRP nucleotidyltransferase domain-containing protein n=1 Tax=Paragonimus heterotremus TaxID=100268 RepID=A0A8J4T1Q8_9TREM|nr:hypothetical protein PHET_02644 [Paragonimus heterotremus]